MNFHKETIGTCELYLGDCIEVMAHLQSVHHVITDPPYEDEAHTNARRMLGKMERSGGRKIGTLPIPFEKMSEELRRAVAAECNRLCDGWSLVFCQVEGIHKWMQVMQPAKYKRTCLWIKPDGAPQFTGDRPGMGYEPFIAHWHGSGRSRWNGGGKHGVFVCPKSDSGYGHGGLLNEHPTKKPLRLMKMLVGLFSDERQTILDPFMGSGSTGVACVQSGRRFIGIEANRQYFDAACRRITEAVSQPDLFIDQKAQVA